MNAKDINKFGGHRCQVGEAIVKPGTRVKTAIPFLGTREFVAIEQTDGGLLARTDFIDGSGKLKNPVMITLPPDTVISRGTWWLF